MRIRLASGVKENILYLDPKEVIPITTQLEPRIEGEFKDKAYWLSDKLDWHIGIDDEGELILVAIKK